MRNMRSWEKPLLKSTIPYVKCLELLQINDQKKQVSNIALYLKLADKIELNSITTTMYLYLYRMSCSVLLYCELFEIMLIWYCVYCSICYSVYVFFFCIYAISFSVLSFFLYFTLLYCVYPPLLKHVFSLFWITCNVKYTCIWCFPNNVHCTSLWNKLCSVLLCVFQIAYCPDCICSDCSKLKLHNLKVGNKKSELNILSYQMSNFTHLITILHWEIFMFLWINNLKL